MSGEAAVTLGATGEGMVAGDMVNTASRVQTAATPGTVLVGEATWRATSAAISYADAGMHELKGKPEPVQLWRATGVIAARGGSLRPTGLEPPFVGRDRELRVLKELLHATSEEGKARLLSVVGVAGVGKSRLAWEFEKYVDGLAEGIWWHRGRCLSYGEGVAYSALAEMVRMRAGIAENEADATALEKLTACVDSFVPDPEERSWIAPRLAHLIGLEELGSSDPRDLYAAWRIFFERLAAEGLTVLVFSDLQWADPGLLDFIDYLLDWARTSPILVLTLSRPELEERRPGWGSGKRGFTSLHLEPLSSEAMTRLLDGMVPGLPAELATRISDQAAGIPLYAVETVRMLLDRGLVVEEDGVYRAVGSLQELEVPESLHALIAARLDSLNPDERRLIQDAAVLGKAFTPAALAAITGRPTADIETHLRALVRKDLLAVQSDPRSPERGQYLFVQDLVRTVAYGTLARRERKQRHVAVADYLAASWGDEDDVAEVIAAHLVDAYEADTDAADAAEIRDRARRALVGAAEHASSLGAPESACRYYERAFLLASDDSLPDLLLKAGQAAELIGQSDRAHDHLERARERFRAAGDTLGEVAALDGLSLVAAQIGQREVSKQRCEEALALIAGVAPTEETTAIQARIEVMLGRNEYFVGDFDAALEHAERGLRMADKRRLWHVLAMGLDTKAIVLASRGQLIEAQILSRAGYEIAVAHNLLGDGAQIATSLATQLEDDDQALASLEVYQKAAELFQRRGDRRHMVGTRLNGIGDLLELGRWDEVAASVAEYFEVDVPELGVDWELGTLVVNAVWLHVRQGDLGAAHRIVDEYLISRDDARMDLLTLHELARAALKNADGDHERALEIAEAALRANLGGLAVDSRLALIEALEAAYALHRYETIVALMDFIRGDLPVGRHASLDLQITRFEARLAAARDDHDEAGRKYLAATEGFLALDRPFWVAVTRLEHAESLLMQQREAEARELLALARATFGDLRARPWLERVDSALTGSRSVGAGALSA